MLLLYLTIGVSSPSYPKEFTPLIEWRYINLASPKLFKSHLGHLLLVLMLRPLSLETLIHLESWMGLQSLCSKRHRWLWRSSKGRSTGLTITESFPTSCNFPSLSELGNITVILPWVWCSVGQQKKIQAAVSGLKDIWSQAQRYRHNFPLEHSKDPYS